MPPIADKTAPSFSYSCLHPHQATAHHLQNRRLGTAGSHCKFPWQHTRKQLMTAHKAGAEAATTWRSRGLLLPVSLSPWYAPRGLGLNIVRCGHISLSHQFPLCLLLWDDALGMVCDCRMLEVVLRHQYPEFSWQLQNSRLFLCLSSVDLLSLMFWYRRKMVEPNVIKSIV